MSASHQAPRGQLARTVLVSVLSAAACLAGASAHAQAQQYSATFLGDIWSVARAVNNAGQIAGWTAINGIQRATLWDKQGVATDLGLLGGDASRAYAINELGQVVGDATDISNPALQRWHPVLFGNGTVTDLSDQAMYGFGTATGINNQGQITINSGLGGTASVARDGTTTWVGTFGDSTRAYAINNLGQVVGANIVGVATESATMWTANAATPLPGLSDIPNFRSQAMAVNDNGLVAGFAQAYNPVTYKTAEQATLWRNGQAINLGALPGFGDTMNASYAYGINALGQVVGTSETAYGSPNHAMLWQDGNMIDLNSLLDRSLADAGWLLTDAFDINDSGVIVGYAINRFSTNVGRAFVLSPVPEPSRALMFVLGVAALTLMRRRRG